MMDVSSPIIHPSSPPHTSSSRDGGAARAHYDENDGDENDDDVVFVGVVAPRGNTTTAATAATTTTTTTTTTDTAALPPARTTPSSPIETPPHPLHPPPPSGSGRNPDDDYDGKEEEEEGEEAMGEGEEEEGGGERMEEDANAAERRRERSKTTTTNRDKYESLLNDLGRLCLYLHNDALEGKFFMDDPHLINAINENEADLVSNITNRFFVSALAQMSKDCTGVKQYFQRSDMRYVTGSCRQFVTITNKDRREFLKDKNVPLSIGLYETITTTLLLMMFSCISSNSYKCISYTLLQLRIRDTIRSDYESDSYLLSWLFCLTTCVLSTAAHAYEMYATDLEKNHPLCQVLLLDHSIENFCLYFLTIGPSRNRILKFTKFVQESGQTGILGGKLTRDDLTLKFFFENKTLSDVIFKRFSPLQVVIGKDNGKGSAQLPSSDGCAAVYNCTKRSNFRTAIVPPDTSPGEVFLVRCPLVGAGGGGDSVEEVESSGTYHASTTVVVGVVCPAGAHPGDVVVVVLPTTTNNTTDDVKNNRGARMEEWEWRPPVDPVDIASRNGRRFARGHGVGGDSCRDAGRLSRDPSMTTTTAAAEVEEKDDEEEEEEEEETRIVTNAFWTTMWPRMRSWGWKYERNVNYDFGALRFFPPPPPHPPSSSSSSSSPPPCRPTSVDGGRGGDDDDSPSFYEDIGGIRTRLSRDDDDIVAGRGRLLLDEFAAAIVAARARRNEENTRRRRRRRDDEQQRRQRQRRRRRDVNRTRADVAGIPDTGSKNKMTYYGRVGRQYQVGKLPMAGTHVHGEGENFIQQVLWKNTDTSSTPPESLLMTPTCWYDWANDDPIFIKQFHEALMASKKKLHALALSLNKPVEFCIWYYYHKYKKNTRVQNSTSSDHDDSAQLLYEHGYGLLKNMMKDDRLKSSNECWICEDGGELVCCETCPGSYHLACLGLAPVDLEGDEVWSCPTCVRTRKLQLSPSRKNSPGLQRQRLVESLNDGRSSTVNGVSIMPSLTHGQLLGTSGGITDGKDSEVG